MTKDARIYLLHIRDALDAIVEYTQEGKSAFLKDPKTQDAVIYKLAVIGEAVKKLPDALRTMQPSIPWKSIAGLRDIIIHDYDSTEIPRIWTIVERDVPLLQQAVHALLEGTDQE